MRLRSSELEGPAFARRDGWRVGILLATVCVLTALATAAPAGATLIVTDTLADDALPNGNCTLREAVIATSADQAVDACAAGTGNDQILLRSGTHALTIPPGVDEFDPASGDLVVADPEGEALTISGFLGGTTIDAGGLDRAIVTRSPLTLSSLTVRGGDAGQSVGAPGRGGAIAALGPGSSSLQLLSVLLTANRATVSGGAIDSEGPLTMINSTVSGNVVETADALGGGGINAGGPITVLKSTIADNQVGGGSGVGGGISYQLPDGLAITGSILSGNAADGGGSQCAGPSATSSDYNLISELDPECGLVAAGNDAIGVDAELRPLADNGGVSRTMALPSSSPAVDLGPGGAACAALRDQRGVPRGGPAGACDAGAYELYFCGSLAVNSVGTEIAETLSGPPSPLSALALGGDDSIIGTTANDALCGAAGADTLSGAAGADLLDGGPGIDTADYSAAAGPVAVTLDGLANDGAAGEGDRVLTESLIGSRGADLLVGGDGRNGILGGEGDDLISGLAEADSVFGGPGNDQINGGKGNDQINGGRGSDQLVGKSGADRIAGDQGPDRLVGGGGPDRLSGGLGKDLVLGAAGKDQLDGGAGNDRLFGGIGRDLVVGGPGKDRLHCGPGRDTAVADRRDRVSRDCEQVKRKGKGKDKSKGGKGKGKGGGRR